MMLFSSTSAVYLTAFISVINAQFNTPKGASECGIQLKNKVPPKNGDCSISGGIFSIGFPMELMNYLSKKGLSMGSGSEDPKVSGAASETGSGKYPATMRVDPALPGHTIYAPATPPDVEMPFLTWGNGACGTNPHGAAKGQGGFGTGYDNFLKEIASHGYVIAANGPMSGSQSKNKDVRASLDWAKGGGAKAYGKVDLSKIATMGHSCGGMEGMSVSYKNPDVKLTLMFNIATFYDDKRFLLKELKAPVAWFVGNPSDMGYENSRRDYGNLTEGHPAFWASLDTGHMGTFKASYGGKEAKAAVKFLEWQFRGDTEAKEYCIGGGIKGEKWNVMSKNWT